MFQNAISFAHSLQSNDHIKDRSTPKDIEGVKVSERLGKLKTSSEQWKSRVGESDAKQFTIEAKMKTPVKLQFVKSDIKQTPPMKEFKSVNQPQLGLAKSPSMMVPGIGNKDEKSSFLKRSLSVPGESEEMRETNDIKSNTPGAQEKKIQNCDGGNRDFNGSKVVVPRLDDDDTFDRFFTSLHSSVIDEGVEIGDFDDIKSTSARLTHKRVVQKPKGRRAAKNPLRALAARSDIQNEYTEIKTGVAEKELRRLKLEQSKLIIFIFMFFFLI